VHRHLVFSIFSCSFKSKCPSCAALLVEILAILAVGGVASGLRAWLFDSAATRVMARLRMRLFSSLMAQEMGARPVPRSDHQCLAATQLDERLSRTAALLQCKPIAKALTLHPAGFFDRIRTGELMNRLSEVRDPRPSPQQCPALPISQLCSEPVPLLLNTR